MGIQIAHFIESRDKAARSRKGSVRRTKKTPRKPTMNEWHVIFIYYLIPRFPVLVAVTSILYFLFREREDSVLRRSQIGDQNRMFAIYVQTLNVQRLNFIVSRQRSGLLKSERSSKLHHVKSKKSSALPAQLLGLGWDFGMMTD